MAKIIPFTGVTKLDLPPDRILDQAMDKLEGVVIIGWEKETGELYTASSLADGGEVIWMLEKTKLKLLEYGGD